MCIICTGEIYKEDLNTLTDLNVSECNLLTSEKLQEILIQCKNLKALYCYYCASLTSLNLQNNKNLEILYCYNCSSLTSLDLRSSSEGVTSKGCINLVTLWCFYCTSLTSLDLWSNINLEELWCSFCTSLTSLDLQSNINLKILYCNFCNSLTSLDLRNNKNLVTLVCSSCKSLTSLNLPKECKGFINQYKCPWIIQNEEFSSNLQRLIKLQKWYRKLLIIKYLKSLEFIEWVYSPNNIGGRLYKIKLLKDLTKRN